MGSTKKKRKVKRKVKTKKKKGTAGDTARGGDYLLL